MDQLMINYFEKKVYYTKQKKQFLKFSTDCYIFL